MGWGAGLQKVQGDRCLAAGLASVHLHANISRIASEPQGSEALSGTRVRGLAEPEAVSRLLPVIAPPPQAADHVQHMGGCGENPFEILI